MRTLWLLIAALLAFAGAIHAQVAAPRLNPIAIESLNPSNPATLPWSGPSRIGAAWLDVEREDEPVGGPVFLAAEGDGAMVQARWVGETFAIGAEALTIDLTDPAGTGPSDADFSLVGVAFQVGELFSVGVGQEAEELSDPAGVEKETLPLAGATLRLAEVIYLGVATGEETVEQSKPGITQEADRTVIRAGVAYHWRDGDRGLHLEVYREEVDGIMTPFTREEEESDAFTVEIVFANILIGAEFITTDFTDTTGVFQAEEEQTTLSLGWAPGQGLAIVASLLESERTRANGDVETTEVTSIAVAWLF